MIAFVVLLMERSIRNLGTLQAKFQGGEIMPEVSMTFHVRGLCSCNHGTLSLVKPRLKIAMLVYRWLSKQKFEYA